jgi:hypothetical protein
MATVHVETEIDRAPEEVWEVIADWENGPARMAPGFVTESRPDGADRVVTFANGTTVKEIMTGKDDARRRLAWSVVDRPGLTHHNGAFTVHEAPGGKSRVTWIADVLPDAAAATFEQMMTAGIGVMARALAR